MADNQRTYKATIDVDTKGTDSLDKLNKSLDETLEGFEDIGAVMEKTRKALQKAKLDGDKVEFKRLRGELNRLQDTFEDTEIQSLRFKDALAAQPGVVGLVGQSIKGLDGGMKVLAANPIIGVVTLVAGLFLLLKESLTKTQRGMDLLNKASEAFGKVLGPIMAIIEAVAFPIFEYMIWYIEKIAGAFTWLAEKLGIGTTQIEEASRASSEALQKAHDEEVARQEELTKKQEEEAEKRIAKEKEEAEKRAEIRKTALQIQREAELALMDDYDREVLLREEQFQADLKALKAAGFTDFTALEGAYYQDLLELKRKYDNNQTVEIVKTKQEENNMLYDLQSRANKDSEDLQKRAAQTSNEITELEQETKLAIVSSALGTLAQAVGENTAAGKALAVAQATMDTYAGASKALATYPPPFGAIAAGTVIAAGLINVKKILSTKVPAPPGTKLRGGGGASSVPTPSASVSTPQIQGLQAGGGNVGSQIAETIAESQQRPMRAYVVSEDISSKQAFDRRVNSAASL